MKLVTTSQFLQMFELGILKGNNKNSKTWTITSRNKGSKRKKHYVPEDDYEILMSKLS